MSQILTVTVTTTNIAIGPIVMYTLAMHYRNASIFNMPEYNTLEGVCISMGKIGGTGNF